MTVQYNNEIFELLYFTNVSPPSIFFVPNENEASPYEQMIEFFSSKLHANSHIVDFGCGAGNTFKTLNKQNIALASMTGVDFNPLIEESNVNMLAWDLNKLDEIPRHYWPDGIDLALSTHVLEHVVDPVLFLTAIAEQLSENGKVFIEVPDCSSNVNFENIAFTNVVHGQHIHYYTKESVQMIANKAGLKVTKIRQLTSRIIPRLQLMLEKSTQNNQVNHTQENAVEAVKKQLSQVRAYHSCLVKQLKSSIVRDGQAALWGLGGDAYQILKHHPELAFLLTKNKLLLFDLELAGHTYLGTEIQSSHQLESLGINIFITPLFAPTREKMLMVSEGWNSDVIDPYKGNYDL
jgi:2-polyprenyl-3-methyl-5-hydroxy-6-metoxy-1,4-benzoquinol methylase